MPIHRQIHNFCDSSLRQSSVPYRTRCFTESLVLNERLQSISEKERKQELEAAGAEETDGSGYSGVPGGVVQGAGTKGNQQGYQG